jgi:membrane protease YdiL (CAAX protease family)
VGTGIGILGTFYLWLMILLASTAFVNPELPLEDASAVVRYGLLVAFEAAFVIVPCAFALRMRGGAASLGFRRTTVRGLVEACAGALLLLALALAYSEVLRAAAPGLHEQALAEQSEQRELLEGPLTSLLLLAVLVAPLAEELFFRGFVFGGLRGRFGFAVASGLSAALFAFAHGMLHNALPLFAVGLVCAVLYERHRSIAPCIATHAIFNLASVILDLLTGEPGV